MFIKISGIGVQAVVGEFLVNGSQEIVGEVLADEAHVVVSLRLPMITSYSLI